jgi:hypothetical protein
MLSVVSDKDSTRKRLTDNESACRKQLQFAPLGDMVEIVVGGE